MNPLINIENVQNLVEMAYLPHATDAFGEQGARAITTLLDSVKLIYQRYPPESLRGTLTVAIGMNTTPAAPMIAAWGSPKTFQCSEELGPALATADTGAHYVIELVPDGTYRFLQLGTDVDLREAATDALVYRYDNGVDRILAKHHDDYVQKVSPILASNFANATLSSLEEAFSRYGKFAQESKCRILAKVWEGGVDGARLVLVNRPEWIMRDSLIQALQLVLRDANARPEHNTDDKKPVDIRVDWFASGAAALIEVKWLGRSTSVSRKPAAEGTYTDYGPQRAQDGADQLADYLDREVRHTACTATRGYLVVFDARRKNVRGAADSLNKADAMHFENDFLEYDPDHAKSRDDFAPPVRFFLNPRRSHFATA
ncbi:hypothetical protein [Rhodospira trueperi]|uniref:Restriction endonuclease n=1 Tax=Rhodospira trueperi TaxID=69960 RepID=A0A1G6W571_9PROT|nr:hypothetical protein [Rhodospira trueperi]SDD60176.1 hypothetical protein SAMN05421720_1015 [Rhodospira trueperi]